MNAISGPIREACFTVVATITLTLFFSIGCAAPPLPDQRVKLPRPAGTCCIGGNWTGTITQQTSSTCSDPAVHVTYTMQLNQTKCAATVTGSVATSQNTAMNLNGKVSPQQNRCCLLDGTLSKAGSPDFSGTISLTICEIGSTLTGKGKTRSVSGSPPNQRICDGTIQLTRQ